MGTVHRASLLSHEDLETSLPRFAVQLEVSGEDAPASSGTAFDFFRGGLRRERGSLAVDSTPSLRSAANTVVIPCEILAVQSGETTYWYSWLSEDNFEALKRAYKKDSNLGDCLEKCSSQMRHSLEGFAHVTSDAAFEMVETADVPVAKNLSQGSSRTSEGGGCKATRTIEQAAGDSDVCYPPMNSEGASEEGSLTVAI